MYTKRLTDEYSNFSLILKSIKIGLKDKLYRTQKSK